MTRDEAAAAYRIACDMVIRTSEARILAQKAADRAARALERATTVDNAALDARYEAGKALLDIAHGKDRDLWGGTVENANKVLRQKT